MPWQKLSDDFWRSPDLALCGGRIVEVAGVWVLALSWVGEAQTGGFVPEFQLFRLCGRDVTAEGELLVRVGLWDLAPGGIQFHNYFKHNLTAEQIYERRTARENGARIGGLARHASAERDGQGRFVPSSPSALDQPDAGEAGPAEPAPEPAIPPAFEPAPFPAPRGPTPEAPSPAPAPAGARVAAALDERGVRVRRNSHWDMLLEAIERRGEDRVVEVIEEMPLVESLRQVAFDVARLLDEEASAQNAAAAKMPIGGHRAKGEDSVEETLARMIMTAAGPDYADQAGDVPGAVRALMQEFGVRPVADAIRRVTVAFKGGAPRSYLERARADAPGDGDGKLDRP